jgi:hypothetical protein
MPGAACPPLEAGPWQTSCHRRPLHGLYSRPQMRILVNHLTRMRGGHVCVAGVDLETGEHARPVPPRGQLGPEVLARHGGPFDIANVVEIPAGRRCRAKRPHVEDHWFETSCARVVETYGPEDFWAFLSSVSETKLRDLFGSALRPAGRSSAGTDLGKGEASLGCLLPKRKPRLWLRARGEYGPTIRMQVDDGEFDLWLPVTDLRLYRDDHTTPDRRTVEKVRSRLERATDVILSVGLTRAYAPSPDAERLHWLQVNNVHLEEEPVWQLE